MKLFIKSNDGWRCKDCGALIMATEVAHPVHFRETPNAGSGECKFEIIPYCPNCEKKPNFYGAPVYE